MEDFKYGDITEKVIGICMKIHSEIGNGFQEVIYQRAIQIELAHAGIPFEREYPMPVYYHNHHVGNRRVDFLINKVVSLEIKAIANLESQQLAQAKNYLEAYNIEVGLLINFGARSLQFKRLINRKYVRPDLLKPDGMK